MEIASFGAGCFWQIEVEFGKVKGVLKTTVGYQGGEAKNPTYEQVCSNITGHIEVVQVEYDPAIVSYDDLLNVFWKIHDPTSKDQQGPDRGTQYRSVIFYHTDEQEMLAEASKKKMEALGTLQKNIVTEIRPAPPFYEAEDYHQKYLEKHRH